MITLRRSNGRGAWPRVVQGKVPLGDIVLTTGDGAGVTVERTVSPAARQRTEILLLDLAGLQPGCPASEANLGGRDSVAG